MARRRMKNLGMAAILVLASVLSGQDAPPPQRLPEPSVETQKESEKLIREVFKEEYAKKSSTDHRALARRLLQQGIETLDDAAAKFVLFREARDLAAEAGDLETAFGAISEMAKGFQVDPLGMKGEVLETAAKAARTPEAHGELARAYLKLTEDALEGEAFEAARKAAREANSLGRKAKDLGLVTEAKAKEKEVGEREGKYSKVKAAREKLATTPEDPDANLAVGEFMCFVKGDWDAGLPLLAKGANADLRVLATKDLARPDGILERLAIGDAWWEEAERRAAARARLRDRAVRWYQDAWSGLKGLNREKVRARLRTFFVVSEAASKTSVLLPAAWSYPPGAVEIDGTLAHGGRRSLKIHPPKAGGGWTPVTTPLIAVRPGEDLEIYGWVLTDGTVGGDGLYVRFLTAEEKFIAQKGPGAPVDQPFWTRIKAIVTTPANTERVNVSFHMVSKQGLIWLDDVSLRRAGDSMDLVLNGSFEDLRK